MRTSMLIFFMAALVPTFAQAVDACPSGQRRLNAGEPCIPETLFNYLYCLSKSGGGRIEITEKSDTSGSKNLEIGLSGKGSGVIIKGEGGATFKQSEANRAAKEVSERIDPSLASKCENLAPSKDVPAGTAKVVLAKSQFSFPGDGKSNENSSIGPWGQGSGERGIVKTSKGLPVGYIYFYEFEGGVNVSNTKSEIKSFRVLVSGASDFGAPDSSQVADSLVFVAGKASKGDRRSVVAGNLKFTAMLEDMVLNQATLRFDMDSIAIRIDVEVVSP